MKLRDLLVALAVVAAALPAPAPAQTEPQPPDTASQLAEISSHLARIAELLELQTESKKLDLVIRRVDLTQRRLEPIEARLRQLRASRDDYAEESLRLRRQLEDLADQYAAGTLDLEPDQISVSTDHLESELEIAEQRLGTTESEIVMLENEATSYGIEIEDWQSWIDRQLAGL